MSTRNYVVLCEESCCRCKGHRAVEGKPCPDCQGKGFTQYPVDLRKALIDLLLTPPHEAGHAG